MTVCEKIHTLTGEHKRENNFCILPHDSTITTTVQSMYLKKDLEVYPLKVNSYLWGWGLLETVISFFCAFQYFPDFL